MRYKYIFTINASDNRIFSLSNIAGFDISILRDDEDSKPSHFTFSSIHLNNLNEPIAIWERGLALIEIFNGACNLVFYNPIDDVESVKENPFDIKLRRLYSSDNDIDITPNNYYELTKGNPFDMTLAKNLATNSISFNNLNKVINVSIKENNVRNILQQLGNALDYKNLYSIYDSLKNYSQNNFNQILNATNYSNDDIKGFTGTANSFAVLGVEARHGDKNWDIPAKTLTLNQAQSLILALCNSYIKLTYS